MTFKAPLDLTVHAPDGMYDPANEHDACGVGMVTTLNKRPERKIVNDAIEVLVNLDHRGAVGAEENTGDGAGILMSMPDEFMRATVPAELPEAGHYAAGIAFLDRDIETSGQQEQAMLKSCARKALKFSPGAWCPPTRTALACRPLPPCQDSRLSWSPLRTVLWPAWT